MIKAEIIADSANELGNRLTTMIVTMPRFILAEFNTHRMLSKNSASSRAIPFKKMVQSVKDNPFIPIAWQKDHSGMQGNDYWTGDTAEFICRTHWLRQRNNAIDEATILNDQGLTKQLCNRLLEPFMWHTVIVTASEWENFFALRCPQYKLEDQNWRSKKDVIKACKGTVWQHDIDTNTDLDWLLLNKGQAEIHMMALAEAMWDAYNESTPKQLKAGEWHIPFEDKIEFEDIKAIMLKNDWRKSETKVRISTAMCARVSYTVVGEESKEPNYENDIKLHDRLAESGHWSPFEHCAEAMSVDLFSFDPKDTWSGNFNGFEQYRKTFKNENITK